MFKLRFPFPVSPFVAVAGSAPAGAEGAGATSLVHWEQVEQS